MTMTYEIARAAGFDVANARMRKAGRSTWNQADYNAAARTFTRLTRCLLDPVTPSVPQPIDALLARREADVRSGKLVTDRTLRTRLEGR